jgi:hypothetical protein
MRTPVAVFDNLNATCTLFEGGLECVKSKGVPHHWPDTVTPEFLRGEGYFVFYGTVADWFKEVEEISNNAVFCKCREQAYQEVGAARREQTMLRKELSTLKLRIAGLKKEILHLEPRVEPRVYPDVTMPTEVVTLADRERIPESSGIYFAWNLHFVAYVGKAINLWKRLTPKHHAVTTDHMLSWVEIPECELYFAEAYYIGTLRPLLNKAKPVIERQP